jgi:uncharacterized peroxidase-related enzyme
MPAMAYIQTIPESEATGPLAELYKRVVSPDGSVDNVMKIHSLNVEALRAHFELYITALHKRSPLSRIERELVGVVVSIANGCLYCQKHHAAGLERIAAKTRPGLGKAVLEGDDSPLTERERTMVGYAKRLTNEPGAVSAADIEPLRKAGLDDRAIHDLAQVVAYFCYANRMVTGLGVDLEGDGIGQHPAIAKPQ